MFLPLMARANLETRAGQGNKIALEDFIYSPFVHRLFDERAASHVQSAAVVPLSPKEIDAEICSVGKEMRASYDNDVSFFA